MQQHVMPKQVPENWWTILERHTSRTRNEICEVRGTKWPSYRAASTNAFQGKLSVQEVRVCNVKIQGFSICWTIMSLGSSSSQI
jgi:hypothetical protein